MVLLGKTRRTEFFVGKSICATLTCTVGETRFVQVSVFRSCTVGEPGTYRAGQAGFPVSLTSISDVGSNLQTLFAC
jgi:hypothetical protein